MANTGAIVAIKREVAARISNGSLTGVAAAIIMKRIASCKLRFYLRAGMSLAESYAAIDAGFAAYEKCLKSRFQR